MTQDQLENLLIFGDVNLSSYKIYMQDEEVDHHLTLPAWIKRRGPSVTDTISCCGMDFL